MRRREFLVTGATATLLTSTNIISLTPASAIAEDNVSRAGKLTPPAEGAISVGFAISRGATMIDFAGPWEVFQDVMVRPAKGEGRNAFELYTVSEKTDAIEASAGMKIIPDYTFE